MATALAIISTLVSAGAGEAQRREQRRGQKRVKREQKGARQRRSTLLAEEESSREAVQRRDIQRQQQRARLAELRGPRETILTGPLGLPAPGTTGGKSLLGQ